MVGFTNLRENTTFPNCHHFRRLKVSEAEEQHDKWKNAEAGLALLMIHSLACREKEGSET